MENKMDRIRGKKLEGLKIKPGTKKTEPTFPNLTYGMAKLKVSADKDHEMKSQDVDEFNVFAKNWKGGLVSTVEEKYAFWMLNNNPRAEKVKKAIELYRSTVNSDYKSVLENEMWAKMCKAGIDYAATVGKNVYFMYDVELTAEKTRGNENKLNITSAEARSVLRSKYKGDDISHVKFVDENFKAKCPPWESADRHVSWDQYREKLELKHKK